ncbi:DUF4199 domain-containing protein [Pedobacter sp. PWIIR3]
MKKNVFIFGLLVGLFLCANMIIMVNMMYTNPNYKSNDVVGYAAMVLVFSLIFFAVRNYRNKYLDGYITFGRALKTGALVALTASTMYVVIWLVYYYLFVPDFIDVYSNCVLNKCAASDVPAKTAELNNLKEMYKSPLLVVLITYAEVLPIGLVVALISALILRRQMPTDS